jgi:SNF2 family DNA or RNA helicase
MGLGKTFQVIAYLHTVLTNMKIANVVRRVMLVVPKNVLLNWIDEFDKWLDKQGLHNIRIYPVGIQEHSGDMIARLEGRLREVKKWFDEESKCE